MLNNDVCNSLQDAVGGGGGGGGGIGTKPVKIIDQFPRGVGGGGGAITATVLK